MLKKHSNDSRGLLAVLITVLNLLNVKLNLSSKKVSPRIKLAELEFGLDL